MTDTDHPAHYDELRAVYLDLIDTHQDAKQMVHAGEHDHLSLKFDTGPSTGSFARGYERGMIHAIQAIEELLNDWADDHD